MREAARRAATGVSERVRDVARFGRWGVLPHYLFAIVVLMTLLLTTVLPINRLMDEGRREAEVRAQIEAVEADSARLAGELEKLRDPAVIEMQARARLGMVRSGETPMIVAEGPLPEPAPSVAPKPKPNPRPPKSTAKPSTASSPKPSPTKASRTSPSPAPSQKPAKR